MFFQILGSFLAVVAFGFLLGSPRKYIPYAGIIGALGWAAFLILRQQGLAIGPATFLSGCLISFCAQILARVLKTPVTIFVITGILPLVPGAGMYHIAASVIQADPAMTSYYVLQTLTIAGMIAISIVVVDSLFRLLPRHRKTDVPDKPCS